MRNTKPSSTSTNPAQLPQRILRDTCVDATRKVLMMDQR